MSIMWPITPNAPTARYPLCEGHYYGVDYAARGRKACRPTNARAFVPALRRQRSCLLRRERPFVVCQHPRTDILHVHGLEEDFFGGYDHFRQAGIVHVADHHIAPGKKQWTWGNQEFGYAWDRNLTDSDGPYIELMAGVYTDNQPDFSFLQPGETKTWSQYWYPIQQIGPAQHANLDAAVSLEIRPEQIRIGVSVTAPRPGAVIRLESPEWGHGMGGRSRARASRLYMKVRQNLSTWKLGETLLRVLDASGKELIAYQPRERMPRPVPPPASEPPLPREVKSNDELYLIGVHLAQFRHATRSPTDYWEEALRRDFGDSRANNAMGLMVASSW